jgi:hypothetical protein
MLFTDPSRIPAQRASHEISRTIGEGPPIEANTSRASATSIFLIVCRAV